MIGTILKRIPKPSEKALQHGLSDMRSKIATRVNTIGIESNIPETELIKITNGQRKKTNENFCAFLMSLVYSRAKR